MNMHLKKHHVIILTTFVLSLAVTNVVMKSYFETEALLLGGIETLARGEGMGEYVNSCPGSQGNRQSQAVGCEDWFWGYSVTTGCCLGNDYCYQMNPCDGDSFQCGAWCNIIN